MSMEGYFDLVTEDAARESVEGLELLDQGLETIPVDRMDIRRRLAGSEHRIIPRY